MKKFNGDFAIAVHPRKILLEMIEENGISQARLARHLKMDPSKINEIYKGRRGISAEMAMMLGKAFGVSAGTWMNLQKNWELSQVHSAISDAVEPIKLRA